MLAPDSVYDLPTRQLYLCHPHATQLLAIAHFRRLPHEHGTLCCNWFRTRLLFLSFDGNWRLCCSSRPFRLDWQYVSCCLPATNCHLPGYEHWLSLTVRWSCSRNATMPP